jgi:molybdopterin/thiamine biosynthesis adenylyltransferase
MLGLGTGKKIPGKDTAGSLILTDPDIIEVSNLSR